MSDEPKSTEPSQWAIEAWRNISDNVLTHLNEEIQGIQFIQAAIDRACADKDTEIADKARLIRALVEVTEEDSADRSIDVPLENIRLKERIEEMSKLLALVPHYKLFASEPRGPENPCADMCIACAWEAMKSKL
jgi:hypothetical protein